MAIGIPNVERIAFVLCESGSHRESETRPLFNKLSILVPNLNARILGMTVKDNQTAFRVHLNPMYCIELPRPFPLDAANNPDELPSFENCTMR